MSEQDPTNFNTIDQSNRNLSDKEDVPIQYGSPQDMVRADLPGENLFVANNSILWIHYKAMPCVLGKDEFDNLRHSHDHAYQNQGSPVNCENGFTYIEAGKVYGIFTNNSKDIARWPGGWIPHGQAYITFDRYYKDSKEAAYFSKYDKIVPCQCPAEFFAEHSQELVTNPLGVDYLLFPPTKVVYLSDSAGKTYTQGVDFQVEGCAIKWGQNRPGNGPTGKPRIISVRYRYQPFYYVKMVPHEQRLKATLDDFGSVVMKGGPTQCIVEQDYVFQENRFRDNQPNSQPASGQGGNTSPR